MIAKVKEYSSDNKILGVKINQLEVLECYLLIRSCIKSTTK